jgi:hypothetical protein
MELFGYEIELTFQRTAMVIAMCLLLFKLLQISYSLLNADDTIKWPPTTAPCPDYWELSGDFCVSSTSKNVGNITFNDSSSAQYATCQCKNNSCVGDYKIPVSQIRKTKDWANNLALVWDGVSMGGDTDVSNTCSNRANQNLINNDRGKGYLQQNNNRRNLNMGLFGLLFPLLWVLVVYAYRKNFIGMNFAGIISIALLITYITVLIFMSKKRYSK